MNNTKTYPWVYSQYKTVFDFIEDNIENGKCYVDVYTLCHILENTQTPEYFKKTENECLIIEKLSASTSKGEVKIVLSSRRFKLGGNNE